MYKKILVLSLTFLFLLSGCNWFSDNPMFPRAKVIISTPIEDNDEIGVITFEFIAVNKVGAQLNECHIKYKKSDGTELTALSETIDIHIDIIPPGTPIAENAGYSSTEGGIKTSCKIDVLPADIETYLKKNSIGVVIVDITFSGIDFAGHEVNYTGGEFVFNLLEGYEEGLVIEFFCVPATGSCSSCSNGSGSYNIGISLSAKEDSMIDPLVIKKVEFYINGKSAGVVTKPPFISETVNMTVSSDTGTGSVIGVAVIYDINDGVSMISKQEKIEDICDIPSPSPSPSLTP